MNKKLKIWRLVFILIILGIIILGINAINTIKDTQITPGEEIISNFEECIAAGNPAMESYPRQCRDPISDTTFVEEIDEWKLDGIVLMKHDVNGNFACFGCSSPGEGPAICIDPIMEMKLFEETAERYCSGEFEVIEK